jgi:hypothetical protein
LSAPALRTNLEAVANGEVNFLNSVGNGAMNVPQYWQLRYLRDEASANTPPFSYP